jgi:Na+/proline symporter
MLVYMIKGVGLFFSMFIPLTPFQCSLIMVGVATAYTIASGFYGVVFSDVIQCMLILVGIVFITVLALIKISGGVDLASLTQSVTGCTDWLTSFPQKITAMPKGYEAYQSLFMFTIFLLLRNIIMGFGTGDDPHYFAARNERDCGKLACLWMSLSTFRWPMMISFAVLGLFIVKDTFPDQAVLSEAAVIIKQQLGDISQTRWADTLANIMNNPLAYPENFIAKLENLLGEDWNSKLHLLSYDGTINAERILPAVLLSSVPAGFGGLILVSLLAASMSTFDTTINKAAAFFTRDIYQRFIRPKAINKELMIVTYLFTAALVASAFGMAFSVRSINDIWGWITMGLLSGLAVPSLLKMYWWRFNGGGFAVGTVAGTASAVIQRIFWPDLPEQWQFVILTLFTLACTVVGTYLTKPTEHDVLVNFYKTTRPFGLWKPLQYVLSDETKAKMKKEHRNDLLSVPFVMTWLVTMFLMPMQLIIRQYHAFLVTLCLFVVSVAFIYVFWYKNLPDKDTVNLQKMQGEII